MLPKSTNYDRDDTKYFRNVHLIEEQAGIRSLVEAKDTLSQDPSHSIASKYLGWSLLQASGDEINAIENAIHHLSISISSGNSQSILPSRSLLLIPKSDDSQLESLYLFGRACAKMYRITGREQYMKQAYRAYQQAVHHDFHCDTLWMSVGLLYYFGGQLRDCLDAFSRSIRSNSKVPLAWRNVGIVVSSTVFSGNGIVKLRCVFKYDRNGQNLDACDCYERSIELGLRDPQCEERIVALYAHRTQGTALPPLTLEMEDFDISKTTCETHVIDEDGPVEIAALHIDDERTSDGWKSSSDEGSDYDSELESDFEIT